MEENQAHFNRQRAMELALEFARLNSGKPPINQLINEAQIILNFLNLPSPTQDESNG